MKIRKLSLLLMLVFIISCSTDDDNSNQTKEPINGVWNLKNVSGGLLPINIDYTKGEVVWTFNQKNTMLIVENNTITAGPEDIHSGLASGTYNYSIQIDNETQTLLIDGIESGYIIFSDNILKINDSASDGFTSEFER